MYELYAGAVLRTKLRTMVLYYVVSYHIISYAKQVKNAGHRNVTGVAWLFQTWQRGLVQHWGWALRGEIDFDDALVYDRMIR